jgi:cyclopropane-fatty-acyl-phospholipid synthase
VTLSAALEAYNGASVEAIRHHYDAGNDFYRLWLDPTLTYSCAIWGSEQAPQTLESAQRRKVDFHIDQARARNAGSVLDIGCGWGGLLKRLVETYNVGSAVGLTLSSAQAEWVRSFADYRISVRLENWFDHHPDRPYDAIVSIEAFEAFARPGLSPGEKMRAYRTFFTKCHGMLKPGGYLSLQTIAWGNTNRNRTSQFIETQIFPESDLPDLAEIAEASERLFEVVILRNDCEDYERTCRAWLSRLNAARAQAVASAGSEIVDRYTKYLKIATIGFHLRRIQLLRIALRRIDQPRS